MFRISALLFLLCMLAAPLAYGQAPDADSLIVSNKQTLRLWATYYYIPQMQHDASGVELLDQDSRKTGLRLSADDWCKAAIEGTVMIYKDGKTHLLNFAGRSTTLQVNCKPYIKNENFTGFDQTGRVVWSESSGYGKGTKNYQLHPFKSIAVDISVIPIGSVVFIPAAVGTSYTDVNDGLVSHDGYFMAVDVGSAIKGNHIDVFLGTNTEPPFSFIKSVPDGEFEAYMVRDKAKQQELMELHGR
ncbi:MAG: 3D domain-containing protein [Bacteroidota bacterium]